MEGGEDEVTTKVGSNLYFSPEACRGNKYRGRISDIWACGITLYFMNYKKVPFVSCYIQELFTKICEDEPHYPEGEDPLLIDLLKKLFIKEPENRITIKQIREHPWITNEGNDPMPTLE